jgi:hypothetical protein
MDQWKNGSMDQGQNQINGPFPNQENQIMDFFLSSLDGFANLTLIFGWVVLRFQHSTDSPHENIKSLKF